MFFVKCPKCKALCKKKWINCKCCGECLKNEKELEIKENPIYINDGDSYEDPLYNEIVDYVALTGKVSTSLIQRKYRLSYNRAARIIDLLEERGIIGPQSGSKPREFLRDNNNDNNYNEINNSKNNIIDTNNIEYLLYKIDYNLTGLDFENFCKTILEKNNFKKVEVTKSSGDYGTDIIAEKDDIKYAIQCKKYKNNVGLDAVQEVIASKSIYNSHVGVVLTNSFFTNPAINLAKNNNILLWDRNKLISMLKNVIEISDNNE